MAGSLNKVMLIGNLGRDPEVRSMQSGDKVCNLSIATSERWKDRSSGEQREKTEWHRIVIFNQGLIKVAEQYLRKGAKVYIEGQIETRKWTDQNSGVEKYSTEIVMRPYRSELTMLDTRNGSGGTPAPQGDGRGGASTGSDPTGGTYTGGADFDDEIPF